MSKTYWSLRVETKTAARFLSLKARESPASTVSEFLNVLLSLVETLHGVPPEPVQQPLSKAGAIVPR